jgi:thiamine monophosphate synthase
MALAGREESSPAISPETAEEMAKYGITRVPADYFYCGGFRYTNLKDAVAQAKRQQLLNESSPAISPETAEEMAKYGITRVPADYFYCGGFRYTNLKDAVAQAKRQQLPD